MYRVIACGVNRGLSFAEKDARDVATFFRSSLGPPIADSQVVLLEGAIATAERIVQEIVNAALSDSEYLILYFSGHGSPNGVAASNRELRYDSIIRALRLSRLPYTMVILDVCFAASYLGFLKEARTSIGGLAMPPDLQFSWLLALASATPGNRLIFSTAANRASGESPEYQNGFFTHAMLSALRRCRGDLVESGTTWISDQRTFYATKQILAAITKGKQMPVERGLTGDFPLAISQADEPIGEAAFRRTSIASGTLNVTFEIDYRKYVDTVVRWRMLNAHGDEIARESHVIRPVAETTNYTGHIECPHLSIRQDDVSALYLLTDGRCHVEWIMSIEDEHGHVLDEKAIPAWYSNR